MYTPSVRQARTTLKRRALKEGQTDDDAQKAVPIAASLRRLHTRLSLRFQKCHLPPVDSGSCRCLQSSTPASKGRMEGRKD